MTSTLVYPMRARAGRLGSFALAFTAFGVVGCGSGTASNASSSSAPNAAGAAVGGATSPAAGSSSSATVGSGSPGLNWSATGTYNGQVVQGPVTVESVLCTQITVGKSIGVQVVWSGRLHNTPTGKTDQISGDMSFPALGVWTIPTNDPHTPVASIVYAGDYKNRYGLSSGVGGLGTGRLEASATSGSVDASYSNGSDMLALKGDWTCSSA